MKTFDQWWEGPGWPIDCDDQVPHRDSMKEAWEACAKEYEHTLKNKEAAIKLHKDAHELMKKKNSELMADLKALGVSIHHRDSKIEELEKIIETQKSVINHQDQLIRNRKEHIQPKEA